MRRPKLKAASKRMSCSKRFKIQRKVREHKRKVKKEAKKKGIVRKPKKDIRVPNAAPFKEDILREAEQRKQMREELKRQQKLERQKEVAQKRKLKDQKESKKPEEVKEKPKETKQKLMRDSPKFLCQEVNKVIEAADVVLEVLDARDPMGSRCLQAEQAVLQSPNKKLLLVLNKIDLVPKENLEKWIRFLSLELPTIAFKCSTLVAEKSLPGPGKKLNPDCVDISKGIVPFGVASLLRILHSLCPTPDEPIKVGLIGFSNVGKSSLVNTLKQYKVCTVGALRGTTRKMQDVKIDESIRIMDSPSIIVSPDNPPVTLFMRTALLKDGEDSESNVNNVLENCDKKQVMLRYNLPTFKTTLEFLNWLAYKRGMLKKKGLPNLEGAAKIFLNDWMGARLCYYTVPPASFKSHVDGKYTAAMKKLVNFRILEEENNRTVAGMKNPTPASCIPFHLSCITNGIMDENEIQEPIDKDSDEEEDKEKDKDASGDENENKMEEGEPETGKKKTVASVSFDKPATAGNDDYDFNTDFF
ncbi:guanine nucleotide-binding protein-like 3 [Engystomops pustulosus]|uniref:guanine nucleotide-binding protein-like 3 n=1 Tax=Engystomops pustulosus TaxID=76066 RepID=UPI003AFB2A48